MIVLFNSCQDEQNLELRGRSFTEKELDICQTEDCPEITVDFIEVHGKNSISEKINKKIHDIIVSSFYLETVKYDATIEQAATDFAIAYFEDRKEFPDMTAVYSAAITIREIYSAPDVISFEVYQYLYTGGAHGYGSTSFLNINPNTGAEYTWEDLFDESPEFVALAENRFRTEKNIPMEQSINERGYWFEDDTFYLSQHVGFLQDSLVFVYNQYDIASYAEGPIEIKLSKKELEPFLKVGKE